MSSRQRQSTAPQRRLATVDVPEYQSLQHPLTPTAQRALSVLSQTHALSKLKVHLKEANVTLTEAAGLINDRHTLRLDTQRKEERRRAKQGNLPDEPNNKRDRQLETLQSKVDKLTRRMEEGVRKIIDGQAVVTNLEETLRSATNLSSDVLPQHSQRRRQNEQRSEDEDEEMTDFEPTDPRASSRSGEVRGPSESFRQRLQMGRDRYQFLSLRTRYAENNDYIGFRRTIHDAQHPEEDAPPLPNPSTWFTEKGAPAAGLTLPSQAEGDATGNASDDDIAIARERISTKCPLTLQEFREPLTSRRCPHTFEKDAIMGLLHQSRVGAGGTSRRDFANGQQTVQCPVAGCSETLAASDLHSDPVLVRKICRIQRSRGQVDSDEEEEAGGQGRDHKSLATGPEFGEDIDALEHRPRSSQPPVKPKSEITTAVSTRRAFGPRSSTAVVVDLGGSDESD